MAINRTGFSFMETIVGFFLRFRFFFSWIFWIPPLPVNLVFKDIEAKYILEFICPHPISRFLCWRKNKICNYSQVQKIYLKKNFTSMCINTELKTSLKRQFQPKTSKKDPLFHCAVSVQLVPYNIQSKRVVMRSSATLCATSSLRCLALRARTHLRSHLRLSSPVSKKKLWLSSSCDVQVLKH